MKIMLEWIAKHKLKTVLIAPLLFIVPLIIIHLLYSITAPNNFVIAKWSAGELLTYIGAFYAFIGTVILSILALWQNENANSVNKSLQSKQIILLEIEQHNAEIDTIKQAVYNVVLSFDIGILRTVINNIANANIQNLIEEVQAAQKNAFNSSIHLELIKNFNRCDERCNECEKDCDLKSKSKNYRLRILDLKNFYYDTYLKKYIETTNELLRILYNRDYDNKLVSHSLDLLSEVKHIQNETNERRRADKQDSAEDFKIYQTVMNSEMQ